MKTKLLLSGLSGSIGIHFFAHIMHNTDWHVVGIASFRHKGWSDRIEYMLKEHPEWRERLSLITHDLVAPLSELTKKKIGHVDYIISMAAMSDVFLSIQDPVPFVVNNVNVALNLLEFAREVKPKAFVQISTDEVYGAIDTKDSAGAKEWDAVLPSNPYAASKAAQEAVAISYWRTYGVPLILTNTMNNYGEMQQANKYPVLVQRAILEGKAVQIHAEPDGSIGSRSYIHSRNFADAILFILKNTTPHQHQPLTTDRPDRYNIAGETRLDNLELAKLIAQLMDKMLRYQLVDSHTARPGHDPHYGLDDTKLKELGWTPPVSFHDSLKNVIEWQTANPEWIMIDNNVL